MTENTNSGKIARPWDLLNSNIGRVLPEIREKRLSICKECPEFIKATSQCKKCGCIMLLKTKLPHASCPIGKWGEEEEVKK
jgi:hypothetical protein